MIEAVLADPIGECLIGLPPLGALGLVDDPGVALMSVSDLQTSGCAEASVSATRPPIE